MAYKYLSMAGDVMWFVGTFLTVSAILTYYLGPIQPISGLVGLCFIGMGFVLWFSSGVFKEKYRSEHHATRQDS